MNEPVIIGNAVLYLGDCREILPTLPKVDAVITDPPWDQARNIPGADDPRGLFRGTAAAIAKATRAVIQLGCYTDPNFTAPLAALMPFHSVLWLKYACPSYRGRVLVNADVAYAFGKPIKSLPGARVIPSETISTHRDVEENLRGHGRNRSSKKARETAALLDHPMPRHAAHLRWLIKWWSEQTETICDPFMGSGTSGVAAMQCGRKFIGIEIEPKYFDIACRRIEDAQRQQRLIP